MSKRHQASRRRTYGRRQHELHQRPDPLHAGRIPGHELDEAMRSEAVGVLPYRDRHERSAAFGFSD